LECGKLHSLQGVVEFSIFQQELRRHQVPERTVGPPVVQSQLTPRALGVDGSKDSLGACLIRPSNDRFPEGNRLPIVASEVPLRYYTKKSSVA
jgi:hypothetical protein